MDLSHASACSDCPSTAACGATEFRPLAAAYLQLRDYIRTVGPSSAASCLADDAPSEHRLRKAAASLAAARKQRSHALPGEILGEPAWDILLELFSHALPQSMKSIGIGAGVPLTSTLRWVGLLERQGLLTQFPDPTDARRTLVRLTAQGQAKVAKAVNGIRAAMVEAAEEIRGRGRRVSARQ